MWTLTRQEGPNKKMLVCCIMGNVGQYRGLKTGLALLSTKRLVLQQTFLLFQKET